MDLLVDGHKREKEEKRENPRAEKKHEQSSICVIGVPEGEEKIWVQKKYLKR